MEPYAVHRLSPVGPLASDGVPLLAAAALALGSSIQQASGIVRPPAGCTSET